MTIIDAPAAHAMIAAGDAVLVDIREDHERAKAAIPGTRHAPLSQMKTGLKPTHDGKAVIFHCASEMRTRSASALLETSVPGDAYILSGGLSGWRQAGLPVEGGASGASENSAFLNLMAKMPWAQRPSIS